MTTALRSLGRQTLLDLAGALERDQLAPPFTDVAVQRFVRGKGANEVAGELERLSADGMQPRHLVYVLRLLAAEREAAQRIGDRLELVWSGPEVGVPVSRDTAVVVRDLFARASRSVLLAGFAVHDGRELFRSLAERLDANAGLEVRMFLNVARPYRNEASEAEIVRVFADRFVREDWPGRRLAEVFYDPRALVPGGGPKASLHAKCVVIDDEAALVTSANFTEAAHDRNIEVGVLVRDADFVRALRGQFESLLARGTLRRVPGLG